MNKLNERVLSLYKLLIEAVNEQDWEKVSSIIMFNPEIMATGLDYAYPSLPDTYKFSIPVECHTHNGDCMPAVRKYVRQAKKYMPDEKRMPSSFLTLPEIEVYRAGEEPLHLAKYRISWTTDWEIAKWFHDRAEAQWQHPRHLYKAKIKPQKIICFDDGRNEREVMQYNSVTDIVEVPYDWNPGTPLASPVPVSIFANMEADG